VLAITTREHWKRIVELLQSADASVERARQTGRLLWVDAQHTVSMAMTDAGLDVEALARTLGGLMDSCTNSGRGAPVRACGEMVNLLWRAGERAAAVRLETVCNDHLRDHPMPVLCGYSLENFSGEGDADGFADICHLHDEVIPAESYLLAGDEKTRTRVVARLQQRERALEQEIERRAQVESALRAALNERSTAEEDLMAARVEAERASRVKSEFLATMSHELRTPLNAIMGYEQLMADGIGGPVSSQQQEYLSRIRWCSGHLLSLINDILDLARIESRSVQFHVEDVRLVDVVHQVAELVQPQLEAGKLDCAFAVNPALRVRADREKLRQILLNLLTNAVKFTPAGGHVIVDAIMRKRSPDIVFLRVRDSGIGIPKDKQQKIFDAFVQLETGHTRRNNGAGLGLAIGRELARGMGGDLRVRSSAGTGSTFTVSLPRARTRARQPR
jgi:signal transduction histidine kinase